VPGPSDERTEAPLRVRPTQPGTVYLWTIGVFSLTLLVLGENLVFLLGAFALGCAAVAWIFARRNMRDLTFERLLPERTTAGTAMPLTWRVRNRRRTAAVGVEIEDRPTRGSRPVCLEVEFPVVAAADEALCSTSLVFGRRGVVDLARGHVEVASRFPLGLFRASRVLEVSGRVTVRPREGRATPALLERLRGRRLTDRRRHLGAGDDVIYGVREFREGDDPRRIHWRTTARRGALVMSEWRAEQGREVLVVLGRGLGAGGPAARHFEVAVRAAATLWRLCAREHVRARLVLGGKRDPVLGEGGPAARRALEGGLDRLASVAAQGARRPRGGLRTLVQAGAARTVIYVAAGHEAGVEADLAAAAGRGGTWLLLRADQDALGRWIQGVGP